MTLGGIGRRGIALLMGLVLFVTACSSDSDSSAEPESESTPDPTEEPTEAAATESTPDATSTPTAAPATEEPTPEETAPEVPATEEPTAEETVHVELPYYPIYDTTVIVPDQALLDELATEYVASLDGATPEMERFLFGTLPVEVFNRIFEGESAAEAPQLMWLMHLSGYFGGRWLRGEIAAAQPEAPLVGFSQEPTEASFSETMDSAQVALDAAEGTDEEALTYAAASLPNFPPTEEDGEEIQGLTDNFGYNQGYMLQILEAPPEGVQANPAYQIECSPGLFDCQYATARFEVLTELADVQATIAAGEEPYTALVAELLPFQEAAIPRGRGVWNGGLSVQGFSQESYDQLLDVSSSFLETVQATGLTMSQATVADDAEQARTGALANAAMIVWLDAYIAGLTNGEGEIELPEFV